MHQCSILTSCHRSRRHIAHQKLMTEHVGEGDGEQKVGNRKCCGPQCPLSCSRSAHMMLARQRMEVSTGGDLPEPAAALQLKPTMSSPAATSLASLVFWRCPRRVCQFRRAATKCGVLAMAICIEGLRPRCCRTGGGGGCMADACEASTTLLASISPCGEANWIPMQTRLVASF